MTSNPIPLLHVMLRVKNLKKSIDFYTQFFGLRVLSQTDYPEGQFTLAFLGFPNNSTFTSIELTYNWNESDYEKGNAFGHLAFETADIIEFCHRLKAERIEITREPGPMKYDDNETIAFIKDPDGYSIELIQSK